MSDQTYNALIDARPAKEARPIQRMEPAIHQIRGVTNVVQPGRCFQVVRKG